MKRFASSHTNGPRTSFALQSREEIYVLFTVQNLSKGPSAVMYRDVFSSNPSDPASHRPMMNQCLLAEATSFYGLHNRQSRILQDGLRQYGRGLSMLRSALIKDTCNVTPEIIVSAFALSVVESSWLAHIRGLERLFALHKPLTTETSTELGSAMLATCRPLLIIGSFFTQTPSVMRQPEWKANAPPQAPDENAILSASAPDIDLLMGVLAEIPQLFSDGNELTRLSDEERSPALFARVSNLWARKKSMQQNLETWHSKWYTAHQEQISETVPTTRLNTTHATPWTTVYSFYNPTLAILFSLYHSIILLLNSIPLSLLKAGLPDPSPSTPWNLSDGESPLSATQTSIHSISRSIEYYLQSLAPSQAPVDYYLFFPIHVARRACVQQGYPAELAWLDEAYAAMKARYTQGVWAKMDFADRFSGLQEGLFG
ncbi:MAG: hypothetical protein Q9191_005850 [Dirinaria sp. TL-2023a]